ncbi:MAG TPA: polyphenol oxidase family protein [Bdellovibrionota bacterium]|jgi:copper oxidase (laccase) domain-containing protein|nr:polyphenol oxidase family protein [Bdellovibrionota bacterium]
MSARLEFPLAQGWSRGLVIGFEDIAGSRDLNMGDFLHAKQVHGSRIYEPSYQEIRRGGALELEADGVCFNNGQILDTKFGLLVKSADCVPLIYVHRTEPRVAAVHAGWRGLQQGTHLKPFSVLGFDPRDTWVWLGPSLNGFEVGEDMWSQFADRDDTEIFKRDPALASDKRRFYPWRKIEKDFKALGVELLYNVEVNTAIDENFASWRRCKAQGLAKIPQQNYSWIKKL